MPLNLKNVEVERLASELARLNHITKTEAIRQALTEQNNRMTGLGNVSRAARLQRFLETRVWPDLPTGASKRWSREEEDAALGYGEWGEPV